MANQFNVRREAGEIRFDLVGNVVGLTDNEAASLGAWLGATVDITGGRNFIEWQEIMQDKQG